ncbi:MAG TPA: FAD-dependent oxidoreductase [Gaiellaceae bacterium]|nr:FAD-dependent oxidoreductase [Gaiellaceae bacterium]
MAKSAAVIGAGIFGASLAYRLARDGWEVTLYERHEPGHERSASGDESRLIRYSHGAESWYTRSAWRSRELWRELEAESGAELLVGCGVAWFARSEAGWEAESERVLHAEGVPVERLDPVEGGRLFPSFDPGDLSFIVWEPEAGVLRAETATRATADAAQRAGARLVHETAEPGRVEADAVVWACGAWLASLFPGLVPLSVARQDLVYLDGGDGWKAPGVPGWVDYYRAVYGMGDVGGGVKIGPDVEGPPFDPERGEQADPENERRARAYVAERFPALADAPLVRMKVCPYSLTPDTHFIVAPHPELEGNWILGGGSGHGFKHGPALAEYAARVVSGAEAPDARFGLGPRTGGPSLRTAGAT